MEKRSVSIHQPNFIPWLGFFHKISITDVFVIIDEVQFAKGSVCNRCAIKSSAGKEIWLTAPVTLVNGTSSTFNEVKLATPDWHRKAINLLKESYRSAPFFTAYFPAIEELLRRQYDSLAHMNITLIRYFCDTLKISTPIYIQSQLDKKFGKKNDLNLGITQYFNGTVYLSGNGAKKYNDHELFRQHGVEIEYMDYKVPVYQQVNGPFIPNLSVLDLLFNEGEEGGEFVKLK